jgi:hypothetical protein
MACYIEFSLIEFIDENGGGPGCGYESGTKRKVRLCRGILFDPFGLLR